MPLFDNPYHATTKVGPVKIDENNGMFQINGTVTGKKNGLIGKTFKATMTVGTMGMPLAAGHKMKLYPATNEVPFFCALYPNDIPKDAAIFEEQLLNKEPLPAMMETIKICSKLSQTINSRIYYEQIFPKSQVGHT